MKLRCLILGVVMSTTAFSQIPEGSRAWPGPKSSLSLFKQYRPKGKSTWQQGWAFRYDLTGVAMDSDRAATLITDRHVVMARHFPRKVGDLIHFHNRKGNVEARKIVGVAKTKFDVSVGLLDKTVDSSIARYPLLDLKGRDFKPLIGRRVLVTDKTRQLHVHEFENLIGGAYARLRPCDGFKAKKLIGGDSGNPSFIVVQGGLVLVETHTHGGPGAGPFYGSPEVQEEIKKAMLELGLSLPLELVELEPD